MKKKLALLVLYASFMRLLLFPVKVILWPVLVCLALIILFLVAAGLGIFGILAKIRVFLTFKTLIAGFDRNV